MTEKTFEELFPDLDKCWLEENGSNIATPQRSFAEWRIRKTCLSKQRVREAFETLKSDLKTNNGLGAHCDCAVNLENGISNEEAEKYCDFCQQINRKMKELGVG